VRTRLQILLVGSILLGTLLTAWWLHSPLYHEVRAVTSFTVINAPADKVLGVLTDFKKYPEWNPYIVEAVPRADQPAELGIVERTGNRSRSHTVQLTRFDMNGFAWSGSTTPGWLLSWNESFTVTEIDATHCRLEVSQSYQGALLRSYWNYYNQKTLSAVKSMGLAVKKRVE